MIALLFGLEQFVPRAPAPVSVVAVGIASAGLLGLKAHGVELAG